MLKLKSNTCKQHKSSKTYYHYLGSNITVSSKSGAFKIVLYLKEYFR